MAPGSSVSSKSLVKSHSRRHNFNIAMTLSEKAMAMVRGSNRWLVLREDLVGWSELILNVGGGKAAV
jgi:hypothetical protein